MRAAFVHIKVKEKRDPFYFFKPLLLAAHPRISPSARAYPPPREHPRKYLGFNVRRFYTYVTLVPSCAQSRHLSSSLFLSFFGFFFFWVLCLLFSFFFFSWRNSVSRNKRGRPPPPTPPPAGTRFPFTACGLPRFVDYAASLILLVQERRLSTTFRDRFPRDVNLSYFYYSPRICELFSNGIEVARGLYE